MVSIKKIFAKMIIDSKLVFSLNIGDIVSESKDK
jgi:hypothetical protein